MWTCSLAMQGGGGGLEAGMRALSLTNFTLLPLKEDWTRKDLERLRLTTDGLGTFDTGTGSINLRDNLHGSVCKGKPLVEEATLSTRTVHRL